MVSDLIDSSLAGYPLEGLLFGGAPAPDSLVPRARKAFPSATMYAIISCLEIILILNLGSRDMASQRRTQYPFQ